MLITNPNYSCIRSYIQSTKETFDNHEVKCKYKSYNQSKDNYVYFTCYNLKSDIKLNDDIYLKEVKYKGKLEFNFKKFTNEVYVKEIPYIMDVDTKVLVFTSDIAQIIVDRLIHYIPKEEIKLVFSNSLILFAEDTRTVHVIPSLADTPNHKLLMSVMEGIRKEEAKIMAETLRYKERQARIERSLKIAVTKKRKILGLDPNDFVSVSEFQKVLTEKLLIIWNKKIENIERHLEINIRKYKKMILESDTDFTDMIDMLEEIKSFYLEDEKIRELSELVEYLHEVNFKDNIELDQDKLNRAADFILAFDLYSPNGALAAFSRANDGRNGKDDLRLQARMLDHDSSLTRYFNSFIIYELFLRKEKGLNTYYKYADFHPAYKKYYLAYQNACWRHNNDYFAISREMKDSKMQLLPLELLVQIDRLKKQSIHYKSLINNPDQAILQFYKDSNVWGPIMQLPYWSRFYGDSVYDTHLNRHEIFNLLMIQPGVNKIDLDNMVQFVDGPIFCGSKSKSIVSVIRKVNDFDGIDRFMVTIPSSLSYAQIDAIINYVHGLGKTLNFICENIDTSITVKKILFHNAISAYVNEEKYFRDRCFINIDPTYYESFLVNIPNNKVLWHKYDYSSDYKYRRQELLSFDRQIELAISYSINGPFSIDYQMLEALLFGDYTSESVFLPDVNSYKSRIETETNSWKSELRLSKIIQKEKLERKIKWKRENYDRRSY